MCGEWRETLEHIICECKKLAQRGYKRRHDTAAHLFYWKLCEKHKLEWKEKWYEHCPAGVVEDDDVKFLGYKYSIWECYGGKETRLNFGRQKREIMRHHWCCCTKWLENTWEKNRKNCKISEFEIRAEKALITEKGWGRTSGCRSSRVH